MVHVKELHFSYTGNREILNGISFDLAEGTITGLIGDSGCGKSTLCQILAGIIPNEIDGLISGEVLVDGHSLKEMELKEIAGYVGLVMQDPDRQIFTSAVEDELAFGPENMCVCPTEIRQRVDKILDFLGIRSLSMQNPGKLSGGQKQLTAIGGILTLNPQVVILDEPFGHLDQNGKILIAQLLQKMKAAKKTIICVEHHQEWIPFADQLIWLEKGKIQAKGKPEEVLAQYESAYQEFEFPL